MELSGRRGGSRSEEKPVQRLRGGEDVTNLSPFLVGDGTKRSPTGDITDQPPGEMS